MNQLLARSVMRRLVFGSTCNRCISSQLSSPSSLSAVVVWREVYKPSSESVVMMSGQNLGFSGQWWRMMSFTSEPPTKNSTSTEVRKEEDKDEKTSGDSIEKMEGEDEVAISSYWGVSRPKITKEDGSVWPWNCFMPWETYQADLSIDLSNHHVPKTFLDKVAYWTVELLRIPTDLFFKGMTCGGCSSSVKRILESLPQVSSATVNLTTETAIVWPVSEAKVVPNWQKELGEVLAKHLTTCGFKSNVRGEGAIEGDFPS